MAESKQSIANELARRAPVWYGVLVFLSFYALQAIAADVSTALSQGHLESRVLRWAAGSLVGAIALLWLLRRPVASRSGAP